eukprot:102592-Amorphochlora_amoeboformis.AAC.1
MIYLHPPFGFALRKRETDREGEKRTHKRRERVNLDSVMEEPEEYLLANPEDCVFMFETKSLRG